MIAKNVKDSLNEGLDIKDKYFEFINNLNIPNEYKIKKKANSIILYLNDKNYIELLIHKNPDFEMELKNSKDTEIDEYMIIMKYLNCDNTFTQHNKSEWIIQSKNNEPWIVEYNNKNIQRFIEESVIPCIYRTLESFKRGSEMYPYEVYEKITSYLKEKYDNRYKIKTALSGTYYLTTDTNKKIRLSDHNANINKLGRTEDIDDYVFLDSWSVNEIDDIYHIIDSWFNNKSLNEAKFNDNFWKWFNRSKVVNKNGEPLIVYHGTSDSTFTKFKERLGLTGKLGFWFADKKDVANRFATKRFAGIEPGIYDVYLSLQNPKIYHGWQQLVNDVQKSKGKSIEDRSVSLRKKLLRNGYDGIILKDSDTDMAGLRDDYVAFYPNQIKSISNKGTYNANSNDINES